MKHTIQKGEWFITQDGKIGRITGHTEIGYKIAKYNKAGCVYYYPVRESYFNNLAYQGNIEYLLYFLSSNDLRSIIKFVISLGNLKRHNFLNERYDYKDGKVQELRKEANKLIFGLAGKFLKRK